MTSSEPIAPWQVGAVTPLGRVVAASVLWVAADLLFLWSSRPHLALPAVVAVAAMLIVVRIVRGFRRWPALAASFLAISGGSAALLAARSHSSVDPALVSAAVVSGAGLLATVGVWIERRLSWPAATLATITSGVWPVAHGGRKDRSGRRTLASEPDNVGQFVRKTHDFLRRSPVDC